MSENQFSSAEPLVVQSLQFHVGAVYITQHPVGWCGVLAPSLPPASLVSICLT